MSYDYISITLSFMTGETVISHVEVIALRIVDKVISTLSYKYARNKFELSNNYVKLIHVVGPQPEIISDIQHAQQPMDKL